MRWFWQRKRENETVEAQRKRRRSSVTARQQAEEQVDPEVAAQERHVRNKLDNPELSMSEEKGGHNPYDTQTLDVRDLRKKSSDDDSNPYDRSGAYDKSKNWSRTK